MSCYSAAYEHNADKSAAVILAYFRIDENYSSDKTIESRQFILQMDTLQNNGFHIASTADIIDSYYKGRDLPPKTVAITFDGGYKSILKVAAPYLIQRKIPFTVFFAPQKANENSAGYLNWKDIKDLSRYTFVTLAVLPYSSSNLIERDETELGTELNLTKIAFREHFGREPEFFSYPDGEYNLDILNRIKDQGYKAAFGLQSGVAYSGDNMFALPRFEITEKYADINHFLTIINALPLPVINKEPQNPSLTTDIPIIGFTIAPELNARLSTLICFVNGVEKAGVEIVGTSRVEIRLKSTLLPSKTRINCTLPAEKSSEDEDREEQSRWIGFLLTKKMESR